MPKDAHIASTAAPPRGPSIQSVDRAIDVLLALARENKACSALEIAAATGLDRTTTHRLLRTLVSNGMAEARGSTYQLGALCTLLGAARQDATRLREIALPLAVDLQRTSIGERPVVVSISSFAQTEVVIIDRIWTPSVPLNIIVGIGWRFPIDESVSGRAMLSTMDSDKAVSLIGLKRYSRLEERLAAIRARDGLEFGTGEWREGVSTLACPLIGSEKCAIGALVIAGQGLDSELTANSPLAGALQRSARSVSRLLQNAA